MVWSLHTNCAEM